MFLTILYNNYERLEIWGGVSTACSHNIKNDCSWGLIPTEQIAPMSNSCEMYDGENFPMVDKTTLIFKGMQIIDCHVSGTSQWLTQCHPVCMLRPQVGLRTPSCSMVPASSITYKFACDVLLIWKGYFQCKGYCCSDNTRKKDREVANKFWKGTSFWSYMLNLWN